ncbi:uncharacterized protein SPAPADRAFT_68687 [Spathaspora passalidarum NRRL Y-27907]|uniref:Uncharacterized protein n=1 Tax=Spathaspora passalidarum (strain NRRL Y-27907 / 11-Y1) TaxID=619300 RepID=G3AUQ8_SPAPN|nr:uncharacterized protein SPAPADRAFT_68687 [Spathaspora passalidarum NRRL Y-27907]EGW30614.1 hypothetical protein SPAPADRAFT_68687 [Spathaspora passalidarum NRRL Y-27907]
MLRASKSIQQASKLRSWSSDITTSVSDKQLPNRDNAMISVANSSDAENLNTSSEVESDLDKLRIENQKLKLQNSKLLQDLKDNNIELTNLKETLKLHVKLGQEKDNKISRLKAEITMQKDCLNWETYQIKKLRAEVTNIRGTFRVKDLLIQSLTNQWESCKKSSEKKLEEFGKKVNTQEKVIKKFKDKIKELYKTVDEQEDKIEEQEETFGRIIDEITSANLTWALMCYSLFQLNLSFFQNFLTYESIHEYNSILDNFHFPSKLDPEEMEWIKNLFLRNEEMFESLTGSIWRDIPNI